MARTNPASFGKFHRNPSDRTFILLKRNIQKSLIVLQFGLTRIGQRKEADEIIKFHDYLDELKIYKEGENE